MGSILLDKTLVAFPTNTLINTQKTASISRPTVPLSKYGLAVINPSTASDMTVKVFNVDGTDEYYKETIAIPKSATTTGTSIGAHIRYITNLFSGVCSAKLVVSNDAGAATAAEYATLTLASKILFTADAVGVSGNSLSVTVVVGTGNNVSLSAALDGSDLTITLGTGAAGAVDDAKNTVALICSAVNAVSGIALTATSAGTGSISEAVEKTSLSGGVDLSGSFTAANVYVSVFEAE